jgi:amino acid transporter
MATGVAKNMIGRVDQTALKFNQACIIVLLAWAFLFNWAWLVALVAVVMLVGTFMPQAGLFKLFYARVLRPSGLLKPNVVADDPQPHLFAQGVGGIFLLLASLSFLAGWTMLGWVLAVIVIALAAVNLLFGFCMGCFMYYQLGRRGIRPSLPSW